MRNNTSKQSLDLYQSDGGKAYHEAIHGGIGSYAYSLIAKRRAEKIQPHILSTDSVLEYGVGPGWNLAKLNAKKLKGFDVASAVRPGVEAQGIEFTDEISSQDYVAYDIVLCSHVLEHLIAPTEGLATIHNCLKPNGKALLYVPFDVGNKFRKYDVNEANHHLYGWSVQSFGNLLSLNGFTIVEGRLRRFGYERIIAIWAERLKLPGWAYSFLLRMALFLRPEYEIAFVVTKTV